MKRSREDDNSPPPKRLNAWGKSPNIQPEAHVEKTINAPRSFIDGATRGITLEDKEINLKKKLMHIYIVKFKNLSLESMHDNLFKQICDGTDADKEVFDRKMTNRDKDYIEMLSEKFEIYIDKLSEYAIYKYEDIPNKIKNCPSDSEKYCKNDDKCRYIPGYSNNEPKKRFSPQLYHILQDYGFFWNYLGIDTITEKKSIQYLQIRYTVEIGIMIGKMLCHTDKIVKLRFLEKKLIRIQFLRLFNVQCCLNMKEDDGHKSFGTLLDILLEKTREEMKENI